MNYLWVFIGGGFGSVCRYGIAKTLSTFSLDFPLATLITNVLSCIILGLLIGYQLRSGLNESWRLLLFVGFCGGFSTFSTFSMETLALFQNDQIAYALLNIAGSLLLCLFFIYLGIKLVS